MKIRELDEVDLTVSHMVFFCLPGTGRSAKLPVSFREESSSSNMPTRHALWPAVHRLPKPALLNFLFVQYVASMRTILETQLLRNDLGWDHQGKPVLGLCKLCRGDRVGMLQEHRRRRFSGVGGQRRW